MTHVMDACALNAFLRGEPGKQVVVDIFADTDNLCLAHAVNLCEVYYDIFRDTRRTQSDADALQAAENAIQTVYTAGVVQRADMDDAFWQQVGQYKVVPGKLSLADCFVLALAVRTGATLVTGDHEFDLVAASGICPVLFIR